MTYTIRDTLSTLPLQYLGTRKTLIIARKGIDPSDSASNIGALNLKTGLVYKDLKYLLLKTFDRKRGELKLFFTYIELFISFNSIKFLSKIEQVLQVATLLEGKAFDQIQTFLEDYLENRTSTRVVSIVIENNTKRIFQNQKGFKA